MSTGTTVNQTSNQMQTNYDNSIIFLGGNRYDTGEYTNGTGGELTFKAGTLLGRIAATGKLEPLTSAPVTGKEGSEFPVGILSHDIVVPASGTVPVTFAVEGDVAEEKVIFQGADTYDTVVASRRLRDRIGADTVGINLVASTELTGYDNQ